jgi:hypothetical protein
MSADNAAYTKTTTELSPRWALFARILVGVVIPAIMIVWVYSFATLGSARESLVRRIGSEGKSAVATITHKGPCSNKSDCAFDYKFVANGQTIQLKNKTDQFSFARTLSVGQTVPVMYLPATPEIATHRTPSHEQIWGMNKNIALIVGTLMSLLALAGSTFLIIRAQTVRLVSIIAPVGTAGYVAWSLYTK